jgi:lauroyl/myristoyl acyltransferase
MPPPGPAPAPGGAETPTPPDWYSHGLNRVGYYRLATAAAGALPRPARLLLARGLGRLFAPAVRSNLSRVLAGARPEVIEARVSETFANFGAFFADLLTLNFFDAWSPPHGRA